MVALFIRRINANISPSMGIPADGSSGFTPPFGAGHFSFWVQELSAGAFPYDFDLGLVSANSMPEPGTLALLAIGLAAAVPRCAAGAVRPDLSGSFL